MLIAAVALGACMPAYFRDVPTSFVAIDAPVATVIAPPDRATLVFVGQIGIRGPSKAITIVLGDGTALGQVAPMSWIAVDVPAGEQTILTGVPEHGLQTECNAQQLSLAPGKVYVRVSEERVALVERVMSLTSHLRADAERGQGQVRAQWDGYWKPCLARPQHDTVWIAEDAISIPQPP